MKRSDWRVAAAGAAGWRPPAALMALVAFVALVALALGGCASTGAPPVLLHLPLAQPGVPVAAPPAAGAVYQLMLPVRLPEYLDRGEVLIAQGATLVPLPGHRWAEPLREAVPRLLRADLAALLGPGRVWGAPLPPGVVVDRQWRVEITALQADAARPALRLAALWTLADATGAAPARSGVLTLELPLPDSSGPALAHAHRQAVSELARALVAHAR